MSNRNNRLTITLIFISIVCLLLFGTSLFAYGNTNYNVRSDSPIELSYNNEGNWWGRITALGFVAGIDSNSPDVIDSYPYLVQDGWNKGYAPGQPEIGKTITVLTDSQGIAAASPFILGAVGEVNLINVAPIPTYGLLPLTFRAASTTQFLSPPESTTPPATNSQYITFSGTATPGYQVNVYYNGELIATTVVDINGYWTATSIRPFEEGDYTFLSQASDPANGIYSNYGTIPVCVDRTPPTIVISDPAPGTILTTQHALHITLYFGDSPSSGPNVNTLELILDGYAHYYASHMMIHPSDIPGYQYRADIVLPYNQFLTPGQHNIIAQVSDNAGNPAAMPTTYESMTPETKPQEKPHDVSTAGDPVVLVNSHLAQQKLINSHYLSYLGSNGNT